MEASPTAVPTGAGPLRRARLPALCAALVACAATVTPLHGQAAGAPPHENVVSANPFGLVLLWFNAEYERAVTGSSTAGLGGSLISNEDDVTGVNEDYYNADLFWRYYPGGRVFDGWAFGAKTGLTHIPDEGTFFGFGFDLNRSWLLGADDNFYVGVGFGLKRLVGAGDRDLELSIIPTLRIVNVGLAF
jgi:hypothetical protein